MSEDRYQFTVAAEALNRAGWDAAEIIQFAERFPCLVAEINKVAAERVRDALRAKQHVNMD